MKTILKYILIFMLCTNCKAQNNNKKTAKMKTFDIATFDRNKSPLNEYSFFTKDSTHIKQSDDVYEYYETVKHKESYFYIINRYYKTGKIKLTGEFFFDNFQKGIWKEYDEQGNLIKETHYDAPYKFTWEDILAFIKKRKIDMDNYYFEVTRGSSEKGTSWSISYGKEDESGIQIINIDGITGKVTREIVRDYPGLD